jgi:hypothetical protein
VASVNFTAMAAVIFVLKAILGGLAKKLFSADWPSDT